MLALIDYDVITYTVGFATEHNFYKVFMQGYDKPICSCNSMKEVRQFVADDTSLYWKKEIQPEPLANALHSVKITIQAILDAVQATSYRGFITGNHQFRETIATIKPYKGNRDPFHKPFHYDNIRKYLIDHWKAETIEHYEADDALAMAQWQEFNSSKLYSGIGNAMPYNTILCTIDKDLDQVPGWHYHFKKKNKYWVSEDAAIRFFYEQLLAGDPTDNIQGIPGIGMVRAKKLLKNCKNEVELWNKVKEVYKDYFKNDEIAKDVIFETADLVYMIKEEGIGWHPPI